MNQALNLSSGPHVRDRWTTQYIMGIVVLALLPATIVGIAVNGFHALGIVLSSIAAAFITEFAFDRICKLPATYLDGSAVVTGLLLALSLSPSVPLYIPILGSVFAILVAKCCFGGLGKNFINPALAGRCFLMISFAKTMSTFEIDGISSATPVAELLSGKAVNVTSMFLGTAGGVIGSSILALIVGGLFLWAFDFIHGEICFAVLGGFTLIIGLFGGQGFDPGFLMANICGGGVVMGAFFMATDYVTSPVSKLGQLTYGCLIGVLGAVFRIFGSAADSFSYSIIIGNLFTPLIDTYVVAKPFAYRKSSIRLASGEKKKPFIERIPKPVIALTAITLIAGLALSGAYAVTKDTIEEQKLAAKTASYQAVLPEAVTFETNDNGMAAIEALNGSVYGAGFGRSYINGAFVGKDEAGSIVGYVISATSADGFEGNISLSVGLDSEGTVKGIAFTELNETPGMGMRVSEPAFMDQFKNRSVSEFIHNKGNATGDNTIDAISGASTSSGAVVNAVNAALDFFRSSIKEGD